MVFSVLAVSFWVLQVAQHEKYAELAENNNQRTLALRAPRGVVFDRNGQVLVENRHSYSISIVREHTKDLNHTVQLLASLLGFEERAVREIVDRHRREPAYRPITDRAGRDAATRWPPSRRDVSKLPDVVIEQVPTRQYHDTMAAHLFGYVGEVSDAQIAGADTLKSGDVVGQSGIEKTYNSLLMGDDGARVVVVNSVGREIRTLEEQPPTEGKRLQLTIDYDVQKAVEDGFKSLGYNGAAVILDPNNGDVLAFTSIPAYDPNAFASGIDRATWAALNTDEDRPLNDRAIQGRYSPGSTFKMAVATAALEEGVITPDFKVHCTGAATFYGNPFKCWKQGGHGTMDLRHAIEQSCNVYFYTIGNMTGIDRIHKWATLLGLGEKSGIDLPNEVQGLVPSTRVEARADEGEVVSGRDDLGVDRPGPGVGDAGLDGGLHGDARQRRHARHAAPSQGGRRRQRVEGRCRRPPPQSKVEIDHGQRCRRFATACGWSSTRRAPAATRSSKGYDVSGKTGTAQVISLEGAKAAKGKTTRNLSDHGWFVFLAPRDNPQIAGVIFAEHGEHGSNGRHRRAPRARHVLCEEGRAAAAAAARRARAIRPPVPAMATIPPPIADRGQFRGEPAAATLSHARTTPVLPHRLGAAAGGPGAVRAGRRDDLQHDGRPDARRLAPPHHPVVRHRASASSRWSSRCRSTTARSPTSRISSISVCSRCCST